MISTVWRRIRRNLAAGLLVITPAGLTVWLVTKLWYLINQPMYNFFRLFDPEKYPQPDADPWMVSLADFLIEHHVDLSYLIGVPGLGIMVVFVTIFLIGLLARTLFGHALISTTERLLDRLPIIGKIYTVSKQILEAVFSQSATAFREPVLIEYPRKGLWSVAFITNSVPDCMGRAKAEMAQHEAEHVPPGDTGRGERVFVFLPTTPNPTSGFLLLVPRADIVPLNMDVEAAVKLVISFGMVVKKTETVAPPFPPTTSVELPAKESENPG